MTGIQYSMAAASPMMYLNLALFGLVVGSFLTACIYRIPYGREKGPGDFGEPYSDAEADLPPVQSEIPERSSEQEVNLLSPRRSFCPHCRNQLAWWHNIPFFSWILLGGKCAFCRAPISFLYPFVELLTALFCVLSFSLFPFPTAVVVFLFCSALVVMSFIDIEYYILPDVITLPGMTISAIIAIVNEFWNVFDFPIVSGVSGALWGFFAGAGFLFAVSEGYFRLRGKIGLGFGDVKLLGFVGLLFGPLASLYTIFIGSLLGSLIGGGMLLIAGSKLSRPLPFGPYLALGTLLYLFTGPTLLIGISQVMSSIVQVIMGTPS